MTFQPHKLYFCRCHLDYFKLITADYGPLFRAVSGSSDTGSVSIRQYRQIVVRFGQIKIRTVSLTFSISRRADKYIFPLVLSACRYRMYCHVHLLCHQIFPLPDLPTTQCRHVPPNSSTTTAIVLFCCINSFISLWAAIVSGTIGTSFTLSRQSLGSRNISDEWIYPTTLSIFPSYTMIFEIPDSTKRLLSSSSEVDKVNRHDLGTRHDTVPDFYSLRNQAHSERSSLRYPVRLSFAALSMPDSARSSPDRLFRNALCRCLLIYLHSEYRRRNRHRTSPEDKLRDGI